MSRGDRAAGMLLGLACGDALGRPVESCSPDQIEACHGRREDMVGYGTHDRPAGTSSDATALGLRVARSLDANGGFAGSDLARRFVSWYEGGPLDVELTTAAALERIANGSDWDHAGHTVWRNRPAAHPPGSGSLMRTAPYAIAYAAAPTRRACVSTASSWITHADPRSTYSCALINHILAGYLRGAPASLDAALDRLQPVAPVAVIEAVRPIAAGRSVDPCSTSGNVVDTLQTALHDTHTAAAPAEAIVTAVNRGGATATVGAITGALAGARFGAGTLPQRWLDLIDETDELTALADALRTVEPD